MKLLAAVTLACVGIAAAEPGGYLGYGGYGGYRHFGKRSADAEPTAVAEADAEPGYGYGYGGYGYGGYGGYRLGGYGGYLGFGGYRHHYGKRSAEADAEPGYGGYLGMVDTLDLEDIDTTMAKDLPKPMLSPDMDTMAMDMADMVVILDMVDMGATLVDTLVDTDTTMVRDLPMLMPSLDTMAMEDMVATE